MHLLVTCEHGGNRIPAACRSLFEPHRALLESHRGYDPGALAVARDFAKAFGAELVYSTTSRLLVELNRSPGHPNAFSEVTRGLPAAERRALLDRYYYPHRHWIESHIADAIDDGESVLHISCHSFTPKLDGVVRQTDIGLLYDPRRASELRFCLAWKRELESVEPKLRVRRNYPYRGSDDGLTTHLRRRFDTSQYAGIELEVNQKFPRGEPRIWHALRKRLVVTLRRAISHAF